MQLSGLEKRIIAVTGNCFMISLQMNESLYEKITISGSGLVLGPITNATNFENRGESEKT
uniref:Uncharacterized protein n=1 Tax=Onchocerca volvulus TaxID=6282 RepID=A0A8R1TKN4_ONCVO